MCSRSMLQTVLLCTAVPAVLCMNCSRPTAETDSEIRSVQLPPQALTYFAPSADALKAIDVYNHTGKWPESDTSRLAKLAAKINPAKIGVLVVWYDYALENWDASVTYGNTFWGAPERDSRRWQDQVDFYSNHPVDQLIYNGELERDGDFAKGEVLVRKGMNSVLVGFINSSGMIPSVEAWASYHWSQHPDEEETYPSGWTSPMGGSGSILRFAPVSPANYPN